VIKVVESSLQSRLMQRDIPYRVVMPEDYSMRRNYPVLYLLHGLFGSCDNWLELTELRDYVVGKELVIVLPEGADGWYTDSATEELDKFESYFIDELIPEIDAVYNTIDERKGRAIFGLSMGGYGALKFGLKWPDLFTFAGSVSGAFEAPALSETNPGHDWESLGPSVIKAFGDDSNAVRRENDLFRLIEKFSIEKVKELPYFYIACGIDDGFLEVNRKLVRSLGQKMIPVEYRETTGGHDWIYWDQEIQQVLKTINDRMHAICL
jgi:putative tributyrin esterase